jgi:hypothetical protein
VSTTTRQCWHLIDQHGRIYEGGDYEPHYDSEQEATEAAEEAETDDTRYTAVLLDKSCVTVVCNGCDEEFEDDDHTPHFPSAALALSYADDCEWQTSPDGYALCDGCKTSTTEALS